MAARRDRGGERLIIAVNAVGVGARIQQTRRVEFVAYAGPPSAIGNRAPVVLGIAPALGGRPLLAGTVPAEVTRLVLILPDQREIVAQLANSTFAAVLPDGVNPGSIVAAWYAGEQLVDRKPLHG